MRIMVFTNCQGAGLAAALMRMTGLTKMRVVRALADDGFEELRERLGPILHEFDALLIHFGLVDHARRLAAELGLANRLRILGVPSIEFDAFHPDLTLVTRRSSDAILDIHCSAIGVWAFEHRIPIQKAVRLFCEPTFRALGYLDLWAPAVATLRQYFAGTFAEHDFEEFFLSARRMGCFMHMINHPRVELLVQLARYAARELDLPVRWTIADGELPDGLRDVIWPLYPEIADALGLPGGGYGWRLGAGQLRIDGVRQFLTFTYQHLRHLGAVPEEVQRYRFPIQDFDRRMDAVAGRLL